MMVTAFVLINAKKGEIESTAKEIGRLDEVIEVYSIAGEYDLIAKVRVEEYERLAEIVTQKIQKIPGIERTKTLMAFKTYKLE
jgi:anthranilate phosphoribosyltransferase